jgi:hypothetical protein
LATPKTPFWCVPASRAALTAITPRSHSASWKRQRASGRTRSGRHRPDELPGITEHTSSPRSPRSALPRRG